MKVVFSMALPLGVALAASVAYAQGAPTSNEDEGMSPSMQPSDQAPTPEATQPGEVERERIERERIQTEPGTKTEQQRQQTGAYMTTPTETQEEARGWSRYRRDPGFEIKVGGGIFNYRDVNARDATSLGGNYTARLGIGTKMPLALEVGYIGTAQNVTVAGLDPSAALVSNGVEGVLRLNMTTTALRPYIVGGAGWQHYSLVNEDFNTSAVRSSDDVVEFPLGGGFAYYFNKFMLDARGEYRWATSEDVIGPASLDNWDVMLMLGAEF